MKVVRSKLITYLVLVIVMITYIVFIFNKNTDIETKLDEVKLKTEINEISKNSFAIMIEKEDGSGYEEVDSFPEGLPLNEELTGCIDIDGKKLENAITYSDGVVTVNVNSTAYCYLYFNRDAIPPESFTFYLEGNSNPTYVTSTNVTTYLSWNDTDIAYYCVTNTQGSDNCSWQSTSGTSVTPSHTLTSGDGTKTVYAYIRDAAGNISPEVSDTIILDSTKPTITSVTKTSDEEASITVEVVASSDTTTYYYKIGSGAYTSSTSSTHTFTGLTKGTTYSISVYVVDNAGLQSSVGTYTFATKDSSTAYEEILNNPTTGLNTTLEGGLYRYQGTSVDNYICFGTSDKDTCLNNTDAYIYRIIGIASDGRIKVMKNEALNTAYWWHNSYVTWPNSDLYKGLNGIDGGTYSNLFIGNASYMPSGWEDKIETATWKYGATTDTYAIADELYNTENAWTNTTNAKIGLMYLHDYYYSQQPGGLNCSASTLQSTCKTSWMHLSVSDSGAPSTHEWTMATGGSAIWAVTSGGGISTHASSNTRSVRPVFFLTSSVNYISGSGTSTDPFIIS